MNNTISYYESNAKSLVKRYESADVSEIHKLLLEVFLKKSYLLEIGCGSGRDANFMIKNDYKIIGIDASKKMIAEAKNIHPLLINSLQVNNIPEELNFENKSFDGIYSIATLMHLEINSIVKVINKIFNYLKVEGLFLFSVSIKRDDINSDFKDNNGRHFTTMNQDYWINTCHDIGFKTIRIITTSDGLNREGIVWLTCVMEK